MLFLHGKLQSDQFTILHMSWQQSCHDMCKIVTWLDNWGQWFLQDFNCEFINHWWNQNLFCLAMLSVSNLYLQTTCIGAAGCWHLTDDPARQGCVSLPSTSWGSLLTFLLLTEHPCSTTPRWWLWKCHWRWLWGRGEKEIQCLCGWEMYRHLSFYMILEMWFFLFIRYWPTSLMLSDITRPQWVKLFWDFYI